MAFLPHRVARVTEPGSRRRARHCDGEQPKPYPAQAKPNLTRFLIMLQRGEWNVPPQRAVRTGLAHTVRRSSTRWVRRGSLTPRFQGAPAAAPEAFAAPELPAGHPIRRRRMSSADAAHIRFLFLGSLVGQRRKRDSTRGRGRADQGSVLYSSRWQPPSRDPRVNIHGGGRGF